MTYPIFLIFFTAFGIQVMLLIIMWTKLKRFRDQQEKDWIRYNTEFKTEFKIEFKTEFKNEGDPNINPISVIIAARNEAKNLEVLIPQLLAQNYSNFEIIVVNDRSTDQTAAVLNKFNTDKRLKVISIDLLPKNFNGKKHALIKGIEAAQYDSLLFTDADCLPSSEHWISYFAFLFETRSQQQLFLGVSPYSKQHGFLNQMIQFETAKTAALYGWAALTKWAYMGVGRNIAYRKSYFKEKGGFEGVEEVNGGDDDILVNRLANKINVHFVSIVETQLFSEPKTTFKEWFKQKRRHLGVSNHYSSKNKRILGFIYVSNLMLWISLISLIILQFWHIQGLCLVMALLLGRYYFYKSKASPLQVNFNIVSFIILEPILLILTWMIGISSRISKSDQWN